MTTVRRIGKVLSSRPVVEGAGVRLQRVFGHAHAPQFDPFLLLDDFHSDNPDDYLRGFPWHPHRGIETVTYVLAGEVEHGDSMGNRGVISAGDVQWMTAGSGIIHQEMPRGRADGRMWGFQLWANLPAAHKMMPPRYRDIKSHQIPEVSGADGVTIRVICGRVNGVIGPVQGVVTDPEYLDVAITPGSSLRRRVPEGHTVFAYVIEGSGYFEPERDPYAYEIEGENYFDFRRDCALGPGRLIVFGPGDEVVVTTEDQIVRFLLVSGKPIGEPVAWYGPIVMNTQAELRTAFEEFERGTFLKQSNGR